MINISLQEDVLFVEFPDGCEVDLAVEQVIYRQRRALFEQNGGKKQKVVYLGQIADLNMSAAKYACGAQFAAITEAMVMLANSNLNLTRANMMVGLHKPAFPVLVTSTLSAGLEWLEREAWH